MDSNTTRRSCRITRKVRISFRTTQNVTPVEEHTYVNPADKTIRLPSRPTYHVYHVDNTAYHLDNTTRIS